MKQIIFIFIFILILSFLYSATINVPGDQPTIQAGIDAAINGDIVLVQSGTYLENLYFNGKLITVGSLYLTTQDTSYISSTIIDGNGSGSVVSFEGGEDTSSILTGFTITNGSTNLGGGIYCENASPSLLNLMITNNSVSSLGGGIYCGDSSSPFLQNVTIADNSAAEGGGIFITWFSNANLENVTIANNSAYYGGGINCYNTSPTLQKVTIFGNSAVYSGGGIYCYNTSNPSLGNVTIANNSAGTSGGGIYCNDSNPTVINSIMWNNTPEEIFIDISGSVTATYSDIEGGFTGVGNINTDPLFINSGSGDYHLQPTSPCIDAGDPASPLDPDNTIVDMGAYYFPQPIADFTADVTTGDVSLTVNFTDLSTPGSGVIDEWYWDFGDGNNSSSQNPANEYLMPGNYTVSLTVTDVNDHSDTETKVDYIAVTTPAYGGPVWHIATAGSDVWGNGSSQYPFASIQHGVNRSSITDTVLVQPGTYYENINYTGKLITVGSLFLTTQDPTYISSTLIDGNGIGSVVTFNSGEDSTAVLCGFKIINGLGGGTSPDFYGGGITCINSSSPSLRDLAVMSNQSDVRGGGIYCDNSNLNLKNMTVSGNGAYYGGGIYFYQSSPSLENVIISDNAAMNHGGGIHCNNSDLILKSVLISDNISEYGGGIFCISSSQNLQNVTISYNFGNYGGGIYCNFSDVTITNSILWANWDAEIFIMTGSVTVSYSDVQGGWTGMGNIDSNPLFVSPYSGGFHLQPTSPCIDAGDPASSLDPDGTIADMGAYYFHQVVLPPNADFTADTTIGYTPLTVNLTDLSTQGSGVIDEWYWDFGDGNNSTLQDPDNEFFNRGSYTVSLTVTDVNDSTDTETKVDYISVLNSTPFVQDPITDFSFDEDTTNSSIDLNNVFDDADLPYGDILSFSYSGNTYINVSIVSGIVTLTPIPDWFGFEDITFTATDDSLTSISDEVSLTVYPVNDPPVIDSYDPNYSPVTIDENESQLFGVSASDVDNGAIYYQWFVDDVPQTGQTNSAYTHTTDYTSAGTFIVKCVVEDGVSEGTIDLSRLLTSNKTNQFSFSSESRASVFQEWQLIVNDIDQAIVVNNIQPVPGTIIIDEMDTINFFIEAYDPDGDPLEYSWKLDGVEESTISTYDFITDYTSAGIYLVTLDVTDNFTDNSIYYEWDVTVDDVDQNIIVNDIQPSPGPVTIDEMDTINFLIDAIDPDGNPLEYSWKLDGVEESTISTYDFITDYTSAGIYLVTLDVTDNFTDNSIYYEWDVTVDDLDQNIIVNDIQPSPGPVTIDEMDTINFLIDAYDPDGNPLEYSWELNGVEESTISTYDFTTDYSSAGNYLVTLYVTDNFSDRSKISRSELNYSWTITVNDVDQEIIVNNIQPVPGPVTIDEMDTINFLIDAYDPDGNPLEYSWKLDGVEESTISTYDFTTDYTSAGNYLVSLDVTDNFSDNSLYYEWNVTVNDVDQPIVVNELIPPEGDITIDEGDVINFSIDAYDPDGNDLEHSWQVDGLEESVESTFDFITDENSAGEYELTLFVTDNFGSRDELNFLWNITVNDVSGSGEITIPSITKLYQNHPNPFNPETNIQFDIKDAETGVLTIFNMKGQIVVSQNFNSGRHNYLWNAQNCSSGVYFYKLQTESTNVNKKMLLLK